jgi:hypothetical protein
MKPVLPTHVVIDNLPSDAPWYQLWIPIIIALISIFISGYSIYYTRKTFILNARPYVWAVNYAVMRDNIEIPVPYKIMLICKEHPAKVSYKLSIVLGNETLFTYSNLNDTQFPDGSEWSFGMGQNDYNRVMNRPVADQALLNRLMEFEYSDLDKQNNYKSILRQVFIPANNQWQTINSEAN